MSASFQKLWGRCRFFAAPLAQLKNGQLLNPLDNGRIPLAIKNGNAKNNINTEIKNFILVLVTFFYVTWVLIDVVL
jgi:uncharacterized protein HemY